MYRDANKITLLYSCWELATRSLRTYVSLQQDQTLRGGRRPMRAWSESSAAIAAPGCGHFQSAATVYVNSCAEPPGRASSPFVARHAPPPPPFAAPILLPSQLSGHFASPRKVGGMPGTGVGLYELLVAPGVVAKP